jgi:hypothetical protein
MWEPRYPTVEPAAAEPELAGSVSGRG